MKNLSKNILDAYRDETETVNWPEVIEDLLKCEGVSMRTIAGFMLLSSSGVNRIKNDGVEPKHRAGINLLILHTTLCRNHDETKED